MWSPERPISPFPPSVNQLRIQTRSGISLEIWPLVKHGKLVGKNLPSCADVTCVPKLVLAKHYLPGEQDSLLRLLGHPLTTSLSP